MLTIVDVEEAGIEAEAIAAQWEQEFIRNFTVPLVRMQAVMGLLSLPPEVRAGVGGRLAGPAKQRIERMNKRAIPGG